MNVTLNTKLAIVESVPMSSAFSIERRFVVAANSPQFEPLVRAETLAQGWTSQPAPVPAETQPSTKSKSGAPSPKRARRKASRSRPSRRA